MNLCFAPQVQHEMCVLTQEIACFVCVVAYRVRGYDIIPSGVKITFSENDGDNAVHSELKSHGCYITCQSEVSFINHIMADISDKGLCY